MGMWLLLGVLFFFSGATYLYREVRYIRKIRKLKIISFARLIYALSFGFVGSLLCFLYAFQNVELKLSTLVIMEYDNEALFNLFVFWVMSVIGYISMTISYNVVNERKVRLSFGGKIRTERDLGENSLILIGLVCLAVGAFSLYMWTKDLGGVFEFIPLASGIRGDYLNVYGNTHTAWRQPAKILLPASYLFYFMSIGNETKKRGFCILLSVVSIFIAILYLICNDGRLTIALYFVILAIGFFTHKSVKIKNPRKLIRRLCILAILAAILLANLDDITYFIRHQEFRPIEMTDDDSMFISLAKEYLFVYKSGITSIKYTIFGDGGLQFLSDFALGITAWLPSRFKPDSFLLVSRYNTALCTGSTSRTIGSIPCDMISLSIYDFGFLGPIIVPALIGALISLIEGHFRGKKRDAYHLTLYYGMVLSFFRVMNYCEMTDFMQCIFAYVCVYIIAHCIMLVSHRKTKSGLTQRF